jgi:hypothetical protein
MESGKQVAQYAASMATELRKLCRDGDLNDLAYLFEVAASRNGREFPRDGMGEGR